MSLTKAALILAHPKSPNLVDIDAVLPRHHLALDAYPVVDLDTMRSIMHHSLLP